MSISKANEHKIRFSVNKENNSPKKQPLLYYYPCYTKPSNLKNLKTENLNTSSSTYFTSSKKNQNKNFFKVINTSLNDKINNKFKVVKTNDNNINENNNNNLNGNINNNTKTHKDINDNNTIINISENDNKANHDNHVIILEEETDTDPDMAAELKPKKVNEVDKKERLLEFFKGKKIYVEIFNGKENASEAFCDILLKYKIIQCKRLTKNIDYIIFKEGHLKTKRYAVMNNIKMVNPLWVDDKINSNIFKDDKEYFVEINMGGILIQENLEKNNISWDKDYENELEAEYDIEYANMIDRQRENQNKSKNEKNKSKSKRRIGREKRKSKATKSRTELIFISENEQLKYKNMVIDDFLETNQTSNKFLNGGNENESSISNINYNENLKQDLKEKENNSINNANLCSINSNKNKHFIFEKMINNEIKNNNNSINRKSNKSKNKNNKKEKCKTPDKIKTKPLKKSKIKTKDYKHKATSKKIMVTKITDIFNLNNSPIIKENKNNNIFPNSFPNNNNPINKEKQNINSNSIYNNYNYSYSKKITEYINKENCGSEQKFSQNNFSSTLGQKINIITYNLEEKEIQCLKTMPKFEYKGDLKNSLNDYDILYSSASVIIIDKSKSKYDWKIYEFFFDKKILIDFASFLFEFMTERADEDIIDAKNTLDTLNKISINEETYFFNKNIRYKKRSLLNSIKIVENISEHKKEKNEKINDNNKIFNFAINKNIIGGEKRVLHKIIKVYLKANIIKMEPPKRSQSVGPSMKFKFKTEYINNEKKENLFMIQKKNENTNLNKIEENKIEEDIEINNEEKNETKEIKGDTYLISREKIVNRGLIKNIPNFKDVISYKYVFDSFLAGELINLNDNNILKKYQFT